MRGPTRYLLWVARRQWTVLTAAVLIGLLNFAGQAVQPYLLGRVLDDGLADGFGPELWRWVGLLLAAAAVIVVSGVVGHRFDIANWLRSALTTSQLVGDVTASSGDAITEELPTGEVVSTVASDAMRVGQLFAMLGQFLGALGAYLVVVVLMLSTWLPLGLVVALGLPAVAGVLAFLVKPLQQRQSAQREAQGRLTTLGADTVSGLRILRGIGGESVFSGRYARQSQRVRVAGVKVAHTQANLDALQVLLPGLLVVVVIWVGAHAALRGEITTGQLVAFYGYAAFLGWPLQIATQMLQIATRAHVAARKIVRVLAVRPAAGADPATAAMPAAGSELVDETSGLVLEPGRVVALVCADPDASALVATRLGRFDDAAESATPVRLGGVLLRDLDKGALRRRVVVAEATPQLFSGVLRDELDPRGGALEADLMAAITVADAHDVLDSTPDGLDGELPEKGRSLSGGQRQRVALARALLTEPEILVLIEPTSAVDAHSEARIAARLAEVRRGRTTLVVTASPLVLEHVDEVQLLEDGRVTLRGTHRDLVDRARVPGRADPTDGPGRSNGSDRSLDARRYLRVVGRSLDEDTATPDEPALASVGAETGPTPTQEGGRS
nr:ABC transporter ATP-binding protein [Cellulosimicrobium arenosum]